MLRGRESSNIEDVRGMGGKGLAVGGGGIGMLILAVVIYLCGGDPSALLNNLPGQGQAPTQEQRQQQGPNNQQGANNQQGNDDQRRFAASVLGSTEDVWNKVLPEQARTRYREPKLVLFFRSGSIGLRRGRFVKRTVLLSGR